MVSLQRGLEKEPLVAERPEGVAGGGDLPPRPPPPPDPPAVKTNNSVDMNYIDDQLTIISKRHRRTRCPEFLTALWMSFAAFTITFISFYIYVYLRLGYLGASSKDSLFFGSPGNNASRVGSEVFFHHIVPRGGLLPFDIYSDFLSVTSREFPNLKFSVYFLLDDSLESYKRGPRNTASLSFTKWVHHMDLPLKLRIKKFVKYHPNINIIVMTLSNYMTRTPLKSKYHMMPRDFLEFYIRVFSVYLHGGAGLDLAAFNHLYATHQRINSQIAVILQTHNNGYTMEEYDMMIQSLDNADDKTISSLFVLLSSMMDEAKSFFDSRFLPAFLFDGPTSNYAQLPKQRSRRAPFILRASPFSIVPIKPGNTINGSKLNDTKNKSLDVAKNASTTDINTTETNITILIVNDSYIDNMDKKDKQSKANDADKAKEINVVNITEIKEEKNSKSIQAITTKPCTTTTCRLQAARLPEFQDLAIWANQLAPYLLSPFGDMARQERFYSPPTADNRRYPQVVQATDDNRRYPQIVQATDDNRRYPQIVQATDDNRRYPQVVQAVDKNFISLDQYGEFMVATGRFHPLLEHVLLAGNYNLGPKFAIEAVIHEHCSGSMQYGDADDFCGTIHII